MQTERITMNYFVLTENSFFKLVHKEADIDIESAYLDFVRQVINLCEEKDDDYNAIALTYVEIELQFLEGFSDEINLYVKKALAFVRKVLKLIVDGKIITSAPTRRNKSSGLRWTGQNTDFIELIYGLHTKKCINDGDVLLGDMLTTFMRFLDIEKPLANCYITYRDEK